MCIRDRVSALHGDLPRTENGGGNSWKRLCSSLGHARDDDDDDDDAEYESLEASGIKSREEFFGRGSEPLPPQIGGLGKRYSQQV